MLLRSSGTSSQSIGKGYLNKIKNLLLLVVKDLSKWLSQKIVNFPVTEKVIVCWNKFKLIGVLLIIFLDFFITNNFSDLRDVQILDFFSKVRFWISGENCKTRVVLLWVNWMGKFDLDWSDWVIFWDFWKIHFQINEAILWKKVSRWFVFSIKIFKTVKGLSYLEFIKFNKSDCFIFLFSNELSFSDNIFFIRKEFFQRLIGYWNDFWFGLFNLNRLNFGWLLSGLRSLFFGHEKKLMFINIKLLLINLL